MDSTLTMPVAERREMQAPTATAALPTPSRWTWRMALVLAFAGLLFFARLGQRALWSEEMRWAEIPREMQLRANYLWPTINGRTYYDKPLGSYWLVLLAASLHGSVDEWAARCPAAVSGVLAVVFLMLLARRLYDEPTAVLAGLILASSFGLVFWSRQASTDAANVAGMLACLWLYLRMRDTQGHWWTLLLWLFMALTSLTKGLLGFVLPMLIIGVYATLCPSEDEGSASSMGNWARGFARRNRWFFNSISLLAIPLGLLVYLSPFLLSWVITGSWEGLQMVYRENIQRFFHSVNHRGPVYLYLYVVFALLAPWSPLLPAALVHLHQAAREKPSRQNGDRFVLVFFWATFVFFTLSSSRRSYYLLPILPAGALSIARLLTQEISTPRRGVALLLKCGFALLAMAALASLGLLLPPSLVFSGPWKQLPPLPQPWLFGMLVLSWIVAVGVAFNRFHCGRLVISTSWICGSVMAFVFLIALPSLEPLRTQKSFAGTVKQTLGADTQAVALFRHRDLVYYLGQPKPLPEFATRESLANGIEARQVRWLILRRCDLKAIAVPAKTLVLETAYPWEAADDVARKLVLIEVGLGIGKGEPPAELKR